MNPRLIMVNFNLPCVRGIIPENYAAAPLPAQAGGKNIRRTFMRLPTDFRSGIFLK
jgi:hypothetical protein